MKLVLKFMKFIATSTLIVSLCAASAVFTVLIYANVTGQDHVFREESFSEIAYAEQLADEDQSTGTGENIKQEEPPDPFADWEPSAFLEAPHILQYPELPRGCEVTTMAMLLQFKGVDVSKMELYEKMPRDSTPIQFNEDGSIKYWGNPNRGFVGSMTLDARGHGIYHGPMFELLQQYIGDKALDLTGKDFKYMEQQVARGIPVMLWITSIYTEPDEWHEWETEDGLFRTTFRQHAALLVGYDENYVYLNDPLKNTKNTKVSKETFLLGWEAMGKQALTYENAN